MVETVTNLNYSSRTPLARGKAECMHASIACLLLYEDYVWVSLGNAMKTQQSKAKYTPLARRALRLTALSTGVVTNGTLRQ